MAIIYYYMRGGLGTRLCMFECNIFYVFRVMNKMSRVITVGQALLVGL